MSGIAWIARRISGHVEWDVGAVCKSDVLRNLATAYYAPRKVVGL